MIGACVALARDVCQVIAPGVHLQQVVHTHKAETRVHLGLQWWSRTRNSDRAVFILYAPDLAKKTRRQLYAYLGGGYLTVASCDVVQPIVRRAKYKKMAAAILVTASLLAQTSPDECQVHFYPDLFLNDDWATNED